MIPNLEQILIEKVLALPVEKQLKVLEFIEQLEIETNFDEIANSENVVSEKP